MKGQKEMKDRELLAYFVGEDVVVSPKNKMSIEIKNKFSGPGYKEMKTGIFVPEEDAFIYALEHCTNFVPVGLREIVWTKEFREMLMDWFYSGNWIKED